MAVQSRPKVPSSGRKMEPRRESHSLQCLLDKPRRLLANPGSACTAGDFEGDPQPPCRLQSGQGGNEAALVQPSAWRAPSRDPFPQRPQLTSRMSCRARGVRWEQMWLNTLRATWRIRWLGWAKRASRIDQAPSSSDLWGCFWG